MDKEVLDSIHMARKEFEEEPMSDFYSKKIAGYPSRLRVRKILKELGDIQGKVVLDIGCEEGYVSTQILKHKHPKEIHGIDVIEEALESFRKRIAGTPFEKKVSLQKAFLQKLPFNKEQFDVIVCTEVIEHAPKVEQGFAEMHRVLKSGGKLVITFPNERLRKKVYPLVKLLGINTDVEKEVTLFEYNPQSILRMLKQHFTVEKYYRFPFYFPITNMVICKKH